MNTAEGNKLIAEFMGGKLKPASKQHPNNPYNKPTWWFDNTTGHFELQYQSSWDWLMPVVEKINKTAPHFSKEGKVLIEKIYDEINRVNISLACYHVAKFIQWYNTASR